MNRRCAVFALFLFLLFSCVSSATQNTDGDNAKVIGADGTVQNGRVEVVHTSTQSAGNNSSSVSTANVGQDYTNGIQAVQTAFQNGLNGFSEEFIHQLMVGSVAIFEAKTANTSTGTVTFRVNSKVIEPLSPPFVLQTLLPTVGFAILIVFLVFGGSYLMLLAQEVIPEQFSDFREAFTGEEKPYSANIMTTACVLAILYPIVIITYIFLITGGRNLIVFAISPHEVTLPDMVSNSIPTELLTGLSAYSNSLQTAFCEYGIYAIVAIAAVVWIITCVLGMLGAIRALVFLNVVTWGSYLLFNCGDIINTVAVSFGIGTYSFTGNPIFLTVGILAGGFLNYAIFVLLVIYAIFRGRKAIGV